MNKHIIKTCCTSILTTFLYAMKWYKVVNLISRQIFNEHSRNISKLIFFKNQTSEPVYLVMHLMNLNAIETLNSNTLRRMKYQTLCLYNSIADNNINYYTTYHSEQNVIVHISRVVSQLKRGWMTENHRRSRHSQGVNHNLLGHVR